MNTSHSSRSASVIATRTCGRAKAVLSAQPPPDATSFDQAMVTPLSAKPLSRHPGCGLSQPASACSSRSARARFRAPAAFVPQLSAHVSTQAPPIRAGSCNWARRIGPVSCRGMTVPNPSFRKSISMAPGKPSYDEVVPRVTFIPRRPYRPTMTWQIDRAFPARADRPKNTTDRPDAVNGCDRRGVRALPGQAASGRAFAVRLLSGRLATHRPSVIWRG